MSATIRIRTNKTPYSKLDEKKDEAFKFQEKCKTLKNQEKIKLKID